MGAFQQQMPVLLSTDDEASDRRRRIKGLRRLEIRSTACPTKGLSSETGVFPHFQPFLEAELLAVNIHAFTAAISPLMPSAARFSTNFLMT